MLGSSDQSNDNAVLFRNRQFKVSSEEMYLLVRARISKIVRELSSEQQDPWDSWYPDNEV